MREILEKLSDENIAYVIWKGFSKIESALNGDGDLDVHINSIDEARARAIFYDSGWVELLPVVVYDEISHFFFFDGYALLQLHIYWDLRTGSGFCKDYIIKAPTIFEKIELLDGLPVVQRQLAWDLDYCRRHLKKQSVLGYINYCYYWRKFKLEKNYFAGLEPIKPGVILDYERKIRFSSACGLINIFKRLYSKYALGYRRKLKTGLIVGFAGPDGIGKTTVRRNTVSFFSGLVAVKELSFGRPSLTLPGAPLFVARNLKFIIKGLLRPLTHSNKLRSPSLNRMSQRENSYFECFISLALAFERYFVLRKAVKLKKRGFLVVFDRIPSCELGSFDSPRIISIGNNTFKRFFAKIEREVYNHSVFDLALVLDAPLNTVLSRNSEREKFGKETDQEIISRYEQFQKFSPVSDYIIQIDATRTLKYVVNKSVENIWAFLV